MGPMVIRGKRIDKIELNRINHIVNRYREKGRTLISSELCKTWDWRQHPTPQSNRSSHRFEPINPSFFAVLWTNGYPLQINFVGGFDFLNIFIYSI